jgi:formiminoglutamase
MNPATIAPAQDAPEAGVTVDAGEGPLLISWPHTGTTIPVEVGRQLVSTDAALKDTDWYVERLYGFVGQFQATVVRTTVSRVVIDVNRDPAGHSLYPGMATTGLCPTTTFDGEPLYKNGRVPDELEIGNRRKSYFDPYHEAIATEIARLRSHHDHVLLYDCHSIRSAIPRLFDGVLPILNIGTNDGASCSHRIQSQIVEICKRSEFNSVLNGRFKGGWITRKYGCPREGVHAVQIEIAQRSYMEEGLAPQYEDEKAQAMGKFLRVLIRGILDSVESLSEESS